MSRQVCYCAFCKSTRVVYTKRRINIFNILTAALGAVVAMYIVWQKFEPQAILIFIGFLISAEVFVQLRWRVNIACKHCGFDPVLYLQSPEKAVVKVKLFLDRRQEDPAFLFKEPLNLPKVKRDIVSQDKLPAVKGRVLSKQI